jgi:tRNA 2-selenouridine synthase
LNKLVANSLLKVFLDKTPLIDVRAPVEFSQGHLPGAINLPILNDEERALVGSVYKKQGNEAATLLGHQLVSGEIKAQRLSSWLSYLEKYPAALIYCFRGGQRSQIAQRWIRDAGFERPRLEGGYKKARKFLTDQLDSLSQEENFILISGPTGSGKTLLLNAVGSDYPNLNLEAIAQHRGSAFGGMKSPQPSQANFENMIAAQMIRIHATNSGKRKLLVEDESRMIGRCAIPEPLFEKMRASSVIWIEEALEKRVQNIFDDYILNSDIGKSYGQPADQEYRQKALTVFSSFQSSLAAISRKLGGLRTSEVMASLTQAENHFRDSNLLEPNKKWIEQLLVYYYDPLYLRSIEARKVHIAFRGSREECREFLKQI